jgi:hypothetical protein
VYVQQKKTSAISRFAGKFFTVQNVLLAVGWLVWVGLVFYVQTQSADLAPFDPFEILKVTLLLSKCCSVVYQVHPLLQFLCRNSAILHTQAL